MSVPVGQTLQNRYVITGLLGHGGMGAVYLATDHRLGVQCAVKETLYTDRSALARFEREAKLLAMLRHPHLPRVTDYFAETGRYYLVMDYVPGLSAEEWVKRNGAVPETQALRWAHDLLDALAYLHARTPPVVHRDIKPANVKITPDDRAVLVDFGIAKEWAAGPGTASQSIAISPEYSPPEQYLGQTDTRTDIYSLGATLYFLLATRLPPTSMARAMGTPVQPCGPSVSPQTEQAIRCAMEMSPEQRWQTAAEMRRALQGAVTPVIPAPARGPAPSARVPPKAQSPATRQSAPSLAGIMAVAVVALIVVGVVSVIALSASGASGGGVQTTPRAAPASPQALLTVTTAPFVPGAPTSTLMPTPWPTVTAAPTLPPTPTYTRRPILPTAMPSATPRPTDTQTPEPDTDNKPPTHD